MIHNPVVGGGGSEITTALIVNNSNRSLNTVQLYNQMPIFRALVRGSSADVMVGSIMTCPYHIASPIQITGQLKNLGFESGNYYIQVNGAGTIAEAGVSGN